MRSCIDTRLPLTGEKRFDDRPEPIRCRDFGDAAAKLTSPGTALGVAAGVLPHQHHALPLAEPLDHHLEMMPEQVGLFGGCGSDVAARDTQDLMAWPFFSLAKSKRVRPIDFRMGEVSILVEATAEYGMATIWDADVLIWVASQIVEARDAGRPTSRLIAATPHEILAFTRRGTGKASYERLKAGLDRLQSTTIATSIRQRDARRRHRFSWINEWKERLDGSPAIPIGGSPISSVVDRPRSTWSCRHLTSAVQSR